MLVCVRSLLKLLKAIKAFQFHYLSLSVIVIIILGVFFRSQRENRIFSICTIYIVWFAHCVHTKTHTHTYVHCTQLIGNNRNFTLKYKAEIIFVVVVYAWVNRSYEFRTLENYKLRAMEERHRGEKKENLLINVDKHIVAKPWIWMLHAAATTTATVTNNSNNSTVCNEHYVSGNLSAPTHTSKPQSSVQYTNRLWVL